MSRYPSNLADEGHYVHQDAPSVRIRRFKTEHGKGVRYSAELSTEGTERAIVDAETMEELASLVEAAARAFALSVRLRAVR